MQGLLRHLIVVAVLASACSTGEPGPATATIPPVDRSIAAVPLDDVVFDTFGLYGGWVPLAKISEEQIERLRDVIRPIDDPAFEPIGAVEWLDDADLVIAYDGPAGTARAYPVKILDLHEIVHDTVDGRAVIITYCPLCGSALVFDSETPDGPITFSNTSALYQNDMVMVDRQTGSYWWQTAGRAIVGPRTGEDLTLLSSRVEPWAMWRSANPAGEVLARPSNAPYHRNHFFGYASSLDEGRTPFPVDDEIFDDDRLAPSARVTIANVDGTWTAWPDGEAPPLDEPTASMYWYAALAAHPDITLAD